MLEFKLDEHDFKIKCFTNVEWISEKFKHRQLKFVAKCEDSDICIVDSNYKFKEGKNLWNLKINVDELSGKVDAFISSYYIEAYLEMIERYESKEYGVGMADFIDIKEVTRGSLFQYQKLNLNSDDETEGIEELTKSLKIVEFNVGVIPFVSIKNLKRLINYQNVLKEIY